MLNLVPDFKEFLRLFTENKESLEDKELVGIFFISLNDLKKNKKASGRLQDILDLEKLS